MERVDVELKELHFWEILTFVQSVGLESKK